jgi:folate-binding protein YgfZ
MESTNLEVEETSLDAGYALLRQSCGRINFDHMAKFRITGEDRKGWLQGQVTNDLRDLVDGGYAKFCILTPTGQIVADCDLWAIGDEYIVTTAEASRDAALERLQKMLILEDVAIEDLSDEYGLWSIQGPESTDVLGEAVDLPRLNAGAVDGLRILRSDRTGSGGWDVMAPRAKKKAAAALIASAAPVSEQAWDAARIESGMPVYGRDITDKTLAMEMGAAFIESRISFGKGCYTGQEIVERIRSRGHANRRWVGLIAEEPVAAGDKIEQTGAITSAAESPDFGPIAAAMIPASLKDHEVEIATEAGPVRAEVYEMPIRL